MSLSLRCYMDKKGRELMRCVLKKGMKMIGCKEYMRPQAMELPSKIDLIFTNTKPSRVPTIGNSELGPQCHLSKNKGMDRDARE